ncbi:M48 family metallopeptidase [Comamonas terrigena]|uniref:M48 family metallopeptidase n=1 Tax=Comamonas terrigena TaxID=32013 RepID=UPI002447B7E0|nr:M48 family metallopeptidase [Comamonas terrigena]MDH1702021.1 M48 family metallopeptidase [Comamonas terrigena]
MPLNHLSDDDHLSQACRCHAGRRGFLRALVAGTAATGAGAALAQVNVGGSSGLRKLVPAETLESAATEQYQELLQKAKAQGALAGSSHPQLQRLRGIAQRLIPYASQWNARASQWRWEVNLIGSKEINAFCMPGGKIAFYTGILEKLQLSDDEVAMVMGHEMAHALREHSREQMAKNSATSIGLSLGAQLLGLGDLGDLAARMGTQLLSLRFSRSDESEADLVGLEMAARAGYSPQAAVSLWRKMGEATGDGGIGFLSTHPTGPDRIRELERNIPRVQGLYESARRR